MTYELYKEFISPASKFYRLMYQLFIWAQTIRKQKCMYVPYQCEMGILSIEAAEFIT